MEKEKKNQGGVFYTWVRKDGKEYDVRTTKDVDGNILSMVFMDKHALK